MAQGSGDRSFEYCDLAFYFSIQPGQDGFVIGNGGYIAGGSLMIRGNTYSQMASANQGYVIRVGTDISGSGDGSTISSCHLDIAIEQNNFNTGYNYIPGTIFFTGSSNSMQMYPSGVGELADPVGEGAGGGRGGDCRGRVARRGRASAEAGDAEFFGGTAQMPETGR